jgi:hypothetical protein
MRGTLVAMGAGLGLVIASVPLRAQAPGQSFQAHRATEFDLADLNSSILEFIRGERFFVKHVRDGVVGQLGVERQRQLMGTTDDPDPDRPSAGMGSAELLAQARQWWIDHLLQPALDIAANPAASCALAQSMLRRIVIVEREHQIIAGESAFGSFGNSDAIMGKAFEIAKRRCLEEAYDECRNTGNGQALINAITVAGRQVEVSAAEDLDAYGEQVEYLFRRCTVYRLSYHMDLKLDAVYPESYTADGSFTLLFQPGETGEALGRMSQGIWRGPREQDPLDITMSHPICGNKASRCEEKPSLFRGAAWGLVSLKRDVTEQTILTFRDAKEAEEAHEAAVSDNRYTTDQYLIDPTVGQSLGSVVVLRTIRHQDGQNLLTLHFGPPLVGYHVSEDYGASGRFEDEEEPMDNGTSLYYSATASAPGDTPLLIDNDTWIQGKYPVLYETAHTATADRATETTHFTFTHRPDLFPADQIIPRLELGREHSRPPPRIPAQPRFSQRSN